MHSVVLFCEPPDPHDTLHYSSNITHCKTVNELGIDYRSEISCYKLWTWELVAQSPVVWYFLTFFNAKFELHWI